VAVEHLGLVPVLSLFHAVVVPSGFSTRVQPHWWMTIWWWCDTKVAHVCE
jgi:hypothetical protein